MTLVHKHFKVPYSHFKAWNTRGWFPRATFGFNHDLNACCLCKNPAGKGLSQEPEQNVDTW